MQWKRPITIRSGNISARILLRADDLQKLDDAPDADALMASVNTIASQVMGRGSPLLLLRSGNGEFITPFHGPLARNRNPRDWDLKAIRDPDMFDKLACGEPVAINANHGSLPNRNSPYLILFPMVVKPEFAVLLGISVFNRLERPNRRQLNLLILLCRDAGKRMEPMLEACPVPANGRAGRDEARPTNPEYPPTSYAMEDMARFEDQIKARMLANFAHELRTPLVSIRGYTKMILEGRAGPVNRTQQEYLTIIGENADKLVAGTHNLSLLAGTKQLHLESFDLRGLWQECVRRCSKSVSEKSIRMMSQLPSYPLHIVGDREKLTGVMTQILGCALRCSNPGCKIAVEMTLGASDDVSVRIQQTGAGIPQDVLNGIVSDFNHISPRAIDGPGIGLSEVQKITCLHGGTISVVSSAGKGFSFVFTLPLMKYKRGV